MKRSIILHSIGAICLSLMLFSCGQPTAETKPVIKDVTETVFASGSLAAEGMYSLTAQDMMTNSPIVVAPDSLAYDALQLMEKRQSQISVLPVVDQEQKSLGLIRLHDIVRSGL